MLGQELAHALVRNAQKGAALEAMGVTVALADALNREELTSAIRSAAPEVIIHRLTALTGAGNFKKLDEEFALTNRLRTEVTDTMLAAARMVGTRRFIAQSFCGWPFAREGGPVKTEEDPLDANPPASFRKTLAAIRYLEDTVRRTVDLQALALRYGMLVVVSIARQPEWQRHGETSVTTCDVVTVGGGVGGVAMAKARYVPACFRNSRARTLSPRSRSMSL